MANLKPVGLLLLSSVAVIAIGCANTQTSKSVLMKQSALTISTEELRIRVRNEARPMAGILEGTADILSETTDDPQIRYLALRWKTEAIPTLHYALFRPDPMAALVDVSAFVEQMRLYFVEGFAVRLDDTQVALIVNAADQMKVRLQRVFLNAGASQDDIDQFWTSVETWASEQPIVGSFTLRESTTSLVAEYVAVTGGSIGSAVGSLQEGLADVVARLDVHAEFLPRQARWQTEMLVEQIMADRLAEQAMAQVGTVPVGIESLPIDIAAEREAILEELRLNGVVVGGWITEERSATLRYLSAERAQVSLLVTAEREAVLEAVRHEREIVTKTLQQERAAAFEDLADIVQNALKNSREQVIDHLMLRAAQLLAIVLPLSFLGCLFLVWFARRPQKD